MAGERSGLFEPMPAVMLSMESARESTNASVGERTEGSLLFTRLEKEFMVRSLAGWNLSGSASYNLKRASMSRTKKEKMAVAFGGISTAIFFPAVRDSVNVKPEIRERTHMELKGTRTFPAL